jgi:hypothetical protein
VEATSEEEDVSTDGKYPEHEKLAKVSALSQKCGEFVEWLQARYTFGQYHEHSSACQSPTGAACDTSTQRLYSAPINLRKLLAEFFEIDEDKLEEEKQSMLAGIRKVQRL